jgi:hypothetical protein
MPFDEQDVNLYYENHPRIANRNYTSTFDITPLRNYEIIIDKIKKNSFHKIYIIYQILVKMMIFSIC